MMGPRSTSAGARRTSPGGLRTSPAARTATPPPRGGNSSSTTISPQAKAPLARMASSGVGGPRVPTPTRSTTAAAAATGGSARVSPTARRATDSPLSVPNRGQLKTPTPTQKGTLMRTNSRGSTTQQQQGNESGISNISNVPTRDATSGRPTPSRGGLNGSARSGTQPTTAASARGTSPTTSGRLGDKATGQKVINSSRVDAELEYDRRKKRLDKIAQVAKQVEKEFNAKARDEARLKPDMAPNGKSSTAAMRDAELGSAAPHRHGSPMRRLGSLGSDSAGLNGNIKRRESTSPAASKRQYPNRNSHIVSDPNNQVHPVTGKAKPVGGTIKDTFGKDLKPWQLKEDTSRPGTPNSEAGGAPGGRSPSGSRRPLTNINKQQDTSVKKPVVCKAFVPGTRKDCNPVNFAGPVGDEAKQQGGENPHRRGGCTSSPGRKAGHPDMFDHPLKTKASLMPGYQGPANGLSGTTSNHDYHRPSHNILGLKHTDKAGSKIAKEVPKSQGKRCSSADNLAARTSRGTAVQAGGNPSEMSPSPSNRRLSAERAAPTRGASPSQRTSVANMLSFDNRSGRSATLAAAAAKGTTAAAAPKPTKRTNSPSFQTSTQNPLSISSRGSSPVVVVPKYKRSVALNRSSPGLLTEGGDTSATGGIPRPSSTTRRKYANASTSVGSTLNWASDSPEKVM